MQRVSRKSDNGNHFPLFAKIVQKANWRVQAAFVEKHHKPLKVDGLVDRLGLRLQLHSTAMISISSW
jgi:hypothetical protein